MAIFILAPFCTIDQHVAKLLQGGIGNQALIEQTQAGNVLKGLGANDTAQQLGNANQLTVTQGGLGGINTANVSQIGNGNTGQIGQVHP